MLSYNLVSLNNYRNYIKTIALFIFITMPIPSLIILIYPELFSNIDITTAGSLGTLGVALTFAAVGLIGFVHENSYIVTSKKDYSRLFFIMGVTKLVTALAFATLEYTILPFILVNNKNSIFIIFITVFIPLIGLLFLFEFIEGLFLKRYSDIYIPYDYYKKFPEKRATESKISDIECMCISCEPDGVKREYIKEKYLKKYDKKATKILFIKILIKNIGSSLLGPTVVLLIPTILALYQPYSVLSIIVSVAIAIPISYLVPIVTVSTIKKSLSKKVEIIDPNLSDKIKKIASANKVNVIGVYPIEAIFSKAIMMKSLEKGFDCQTQAAYLPVRKKEGYIFLGHAYRVGDESLDVVIMHEIGHGTRNSTRYGRFCDILTSIASILLFYFMVSGGGILLSSLLFLPVAFLLRILRMHFSRSLEFSADNFAAKINNRENLIAFFEKIDRYLAARKDYSSIDDAFEFLSTHPSIEKRITNLKRKI